MRLYNVAASRVVRRKVVLAALESRCVGVGFQRYFDLWQYYQKELALLSSCLSETKGRPAAKKATPTSQFVQRRRFRPERVDVLIRHLGT